MGQDLKGVLATIEVSGANFTFRPDLGTPIFDNDPSAAMEIPVKILLYERDGKTEIRYKKSSSCWRITRASRAWGRNWMSCSAS